MTAGLALKEIFGDADRRFLFGARADVLAFGGATALSLLLLGAGALTGTLHAEVSPWLWLALVVGIDAAHVWSTLFRVYLDPVEVRRRLLLYVGTPLAVYLGGVVLYGFSPHAFWRAVAYLAVWHFMRQQVGWLRLYHRRDPQLGSAEKRIEEALLWALMLHPILHWHAHLPRRFVWMLEGDFVAGVPPLVANVFGALTALLALLWLATQVRARVRHREIPWGRVLLLATTACAWYVGIVVFDSDYAFTVTNIPLHGIPYALLTFRYGTTRAAQTKSGPLALVLRGGVPAFLLVCWAIAALEELGWDRVVWHDHPAFFGRGSVLDDDLVALLAPLLAVPQLTHYVLDGFVWRRAGNE